MKKIYKIFLFLILIVKVGDISAAEYSMKYYRCLVDSSGNYVKLTDTIDANTTYKIVNIDSLSYTGVNYCIGTNSTVKLACQTDTTASASDILKDKTAYINGVKTTGILTDYGAEPIAGKLDADNGELYLYVPDISSGEQNKGVVQSAIKTDLSNLGNATAADVAKGKTFTSSAGLKAVGTKEESSGTLYHSSTAYAVGEKKGSYQTTADVGSSKKATSIVAEYYTEGNYEGPWTAYVEGSNDNSNWTTISSKSFTYHTTITTSSTTAYRYYRARMTMLGTVQNVSIVVLA